MTTIKTFNRAELARAITLVESTRRDHQREARELIESLLPQTGKSIRIGITGVPGVGKSTFIEAFGLHAISQGHRVAVLAIDPSSHHSGGSILGDKTRMPELTQHEAAFIRPSPTSGTLGGVARHTREAMLLCEAAGYDIIIVETVGVGQSEIEVARMVDIFTLLLLPGSGDELQGIKKGIVELADILVVNKADGDLLAQAKRVQSDYASAVRLLQRKNSAWQPEVLTCSAHEKVGVGHVWGTILQCAEVLKSAGNFEKNRIEQHCHWLHEELKHQMIEMLEADKHFAAELADAEMRVTRGVSLPSQAAATLIESVFHTQPIKATA